MLHLFVVTGSLSRLASQEILRGHLKLGETDKAVIVSTLPWQGEPPGPSVELFVMDPPASRLSAWAQPFELARWVQDWRRRLPEQSTTLYVPQVFEVPGNLACFSWPEVVRRELLPDGLANYVPRDLFPERFKKRLGFGARVGLRWLACACHRERYRPIVRGDITQSDRLPFDRTWTFEPQGLKTRAGAIEKLLFPVEWSSAAVEPELALIVDQEILDIAAPSLERELRARMLDWLLQSGIRRVLYKPHPRGKDRTRTLAGAGLDVERVDGAFAEQIALATGAGTIVGFYSTPLLMLRETWRRRVAFLPHAESPRCPRGRFVRELGDAFSAAEVELVVVN